MGGVNGFGVNVSQDRGGDGVAFSRMFGFTSAMDRVLSALSLRQSILADNIANVNTPGFKRSDVDFRAVADQVFKDMVGPGAYRRSLPARTQGQPVVVQERSTSMRNDGNNVDIEREMAMLAETTIRYNTLAEYVTRRLRDIRTVIDAGRR